MKTHEEMSARATQLSIDLVAGDMAPRYINGEKQLVIKSAVITEQGMSSGLPLVDLLFEDAEGNEYFAMITGRLVNGLAASIRGVNVRNHGNPEP